MFASAVGDLTLSRDMKQTSGKSARDDARLPLSLPSLSDGKTKKKPLESRKMVVEWSIGVHEGRTAEQENGTGLEDWRAELGRLKR
jgi:hypothetical protein